jgi:hypothetical protein
MTNLKKRIDKIETSLNGGRYATLEEMVAGTDDPNSKPLRPEFERFFNRIAGEKQNVQNESRNLKGK